jgi:hypothetical protein
MEHWKVVEAYNAGVEAQNRAPGGYFRPVEAHSHHFDEEQYLDQH